MALQIVEQADIDVIVYTDIKVTAMRLNDVGFQDTSKASTCGLAE